MNTDSLHNRKSGEPTSDYKPNNPLQADFEETGSDLNEDERYLVRSTSTTSHLFGVENGFLRAKLVGEYGPGRRTMQL
jgi:hypothetical protein